MTLPLHDILIGPDELARIKAGEVVELMTDKQMMVALVLERHYDQTPLRNGSELIPITPGMIRFVEDEGHTSWIPVRSPYIFGIVLAA
jgi:hypothetical protein